MTPTFLWLKTLLMVKERNSYVVISKSHVDVLIKRRSATKALLMSAKICTKAVLTIGVSTSLTFTKEWIPMLTAQSKQRSLNILMVLSTSL